MPVAATTAVLALPARAAGTPRVVTTFTVLADMAVQRRRRRRRGRVDHQARRPRSTTTSPPPGTSAARATRTWCSGNGLNLELWFEQFLSRLGDVPERDAVRRRRADPDRQRPLRRQAEPARLDEPGGGPRVRRQHRRGADGRWRPSSASTFEANAARYKGEIRGILDPVRARLANLPRPQRCARHQRGRVQLPGARSRPRRALPVGHQRRMPRAPRSWSAR